MIKLSVIHTNVIDLATLSISCLKHNTVDIHFNIRVLSHIGALLVFIPLLYKLITITAIITDRDVIVMTTHKYIPEIKIIKVQKSYIQCFVHNQRRYHQHGCNVIVTKTHNKINKFLKLKTIQSIISFYNLKNLDSFI